MRPIVILQLQNKALNTASDIASDIAMRMTFDVQHLSADQLVTIDEWVESHDAALVVVGIDAKTKLQPLLNSFRGLRVPYLFVKPGQHFTCRHIALPVTRFLEDREKGPYCGTFARYYNSRVTIFKPHDYGSAAQQNIDSVSSLLRSRQIETEIVCGRKDSDSIQLEASQSDCDFCIITASRDYGLDDIIFGPKERKIIKIAQSPVMVINPRGDLYPLCD